MYLVDTNIFLEVMLSQARSKECEVFLKSVKEGVSKAFITDFSIYSIMIIMSGLSKLDELKVFLSSLSAYRGLAIHRNGLKELLRAVETMKEKHLDLDDAIQYSAAMSLGVKAIVSFDKHFDGLEVPRAEPARLV
ncbi:MAG: type II toxin-antitoxin system VapC family toxin [Candidatus Brockarchaeota archaeon]|nr:type II toxin-antitoxin system VapC family toxin [Candidatus Brockarchaeota archaeon]